MGNENRRLLKFVSRFTIVHVVTYLIFGISFMLITNYFDVFNEHQLMSTVMRSSDSIWVRCAVLFQFVRGALISVVIYPIRESILNKKHGWLKLFFLLWILTGIGSVITGPGSIEGLIYTKLGFGNPLVGLPEITLQMLTFSFVFTKLMDSNAEIDN